MGTNDGFQTCSFGDCNLIIDKDNYLQLDFLRETGPFRFKLEWEANNVVQSMEWTQAQNPLTATNKASVVKTFIFLRDFINHIVKNSLSKPFLNAMKSTLVWYKNRFLMS